MAPQTLTANTAWDVNSKSVDFQWQWLHDDGFRDYEDDATNRRIEKAYRDGRPFIFIKSGKRKTEPMEVFFTDMTQHDPRTGNTRSIRRVGPESLKFKAQRKVNECLRVIEHGSMPSKSRMFRECEREREEMLEGIDQREFDITAFHHERGCCARIARSSAGRILSALVVFLNVLWLGIEANYNKADTLYEADLVFIVVENVFCTYFLIELMIRFFAFKVKRNALRDGWIIFDLALLVLMVGETWLIPAFMKLSKKKLVAGRGGWAVLRCARLLKIARLGRLARIIRHCPELMTMCKAIFIAMRSVFFTLMLLTILLYVFAIIFVTQLRGNTAVTDEIKDFKTMHGAMWVLTIECVLLDGPKDTLNILVQHSYVLTAAFLFFIGISAFTLVNMLLGIICNVIDQVSQSEKEEADVGYLKTSLLDIMESHDEDGDRRLRKDEFDLLLQNRLAIFYLERFGVDVDDLISLKENLFDHADSSLSRNSFTQADGQRPAEPGLSFAEFLRVVMRLRGGNAVKVTDMVDLREFVKSRLDTNREYVSQRLHRLEERLLGPLMLPQVDMESQQARLRDVAAVVATPQVRSDMPGEKNDAVHSQAELSTGLELSLPDTSKPEKSEKLARSEDDDAASVQVRAQLAEIWAGQLRLARRQAEFENHQSAIQVATQERVAQELVELQKKLGKLSHRAELRQPPGATGVSPHAATCQGWRVNQSSSSFSGIANVSQTSGFWRQFAVRGCQDEDV